MQSWKTLLAVLSLASCAVDEAESSKPIGPRPVRISDAEAAKMLEGVTLGEPRLCDDGCMLRDPSLFTDLDAFIKAEREGHADGGAQGEDAQPR